MTTVHHDELWSETFDHRMGPHGFIQLGYKAVFQEGSVAVPTGEVDIVSPGVMVRSVNESYAYREAMDRADDAASWNDKLPDTVWSPEEFQEAVRTVLAWAKDPPADLGGAFSHHGIHAVLPVMASGRPVQVGFQGSTCAFYAYEKNVRSDVRKWANWGVSEYDPGIVCGLIAEVVGALPAQEWNDRRSTMWPINPHQRIREAFVGGWGPFDGNAPEGWR